jgi:hypothetical protein
MSLKVLKYGSVSLFAVLLIGSLIFGTDLFSYVSTSAGNVRESVRDSVPVEFELQRARDLIDEILPEIHASVRVIAQDEIEIASLEKDLGESQDQLKKDRRALAILRDKMNVETVSYQVGTRKVSRGQLAESVSHRFDRLKDAELVLASKERLLDTRRGSLNAAVQLLDKARNRKMQLEQKVEALVAQHRLVQASAVGSRVHVNDTKLAKADKLLTEIQKRLMVAERVLEHEQTELVLGEGEIIDEAGMLADIDAHLGKASAEPVANAGSPTTK